MSDLLAALAVFVSFGTAYYSTRIEKRVRDQSDRRSRFDATVYNPIEAQLQLLTTIIHELARAAMVQNQQDRIAALSAIQTKDHQTWYFSMLGCLDAIDDGENRDLVEAYLNSYWDRMADAINGLGLELDPVQPHDAVKSLSRAGQEFLSKARKDLQSVRSKL